MISKTFMAFAKGTDTSKVVEFNRYWGIAPCFVKAVNPNKAEMEQLFNTTIENEPTYVGELDVDGEKIINARVTFVVQPDVEGVEPISISFFVRHQYRFNRDKTKIQVIDKYARTAWVTKEDLTTHNIPIYSNGKPANIDKDYRPVFVGEENLTKFMIEYLGVPSLEYFRDGEWHKNPNPEDCVARFDGIEKIFTGDVKEIKEIIALQPTNKVKIMFGVRNTNDGKQYQTFFSDGFRRNNAQKKTTLTFFEKELEERKSIGAYSTSEFKVGDFEKYSVQPTEIKPNDTSDLPFGDDPFSTTPKTPWE